MPPNSLPNDQEGWIAHMKGLISFAEAATQSALTHEQPLERSRRTMEKLQRFSTTESDKALRILDQMPAEERARMTPRCTLGCAYCCYQWVRASVLEVFAVGRHVRENFTDEQLTDLLQKTRDYEEQFREQDQSTMFSIACPLLVNNLCSVYEARPLICRGTASLDVEACRLGKEDPNSGVKVPFVGPLFQIAGALRRGIVNGTTLSRFPDKEVVLGIALRILLEDPSAEERYFQGEDVFAAAEAPDTDPLPLQMRAT